MVDIPTVPISDAEEEDSFSVIRLNSLVAHHALMCLELQDVAEGRTPNLMLLLPPGSAKSTYVDVVFVPWYMARFPRKNVILASYATNIARKQGRRARQLIRSKAFGSLFPDVTLSQASSAADEWALSTGGEYMAGGLLSGLTGNRAALGIVDDPIAGREEAESETIRDKSWDAYIDDFCSRLTPGAPQVFITTRWHEDDPAGRILPEGWAGESGDFEGRDGRKWRVICLPAICERDDDPLGRNVGDTLWPEWFSLSHWEPFRRSSRTWSSLYQQRPAPDEGTFFQRDWFNRYKPGEQPKNMHIYGTSDYAVTEDGGDYTVHRVWGIPPDGSIWMLDGWRGQTTSDVWIDKQLDLWVRHKPFAWFGERGVIAAAIEPMLRRRMLERKIGGRLEWLPSIHDKPTRARGFQARAAMKTVHLPATPDGDAVLDEYLRFPAGKHDDDVDCASLIGRALDQAHPAIVKQDEQKTGNPPDLNDWRGSERETASWSVA
jgi:predicted phage terminase large subunit-like protein